METTTDEPSLWHRWRGASGRWRRRMRQRVLEPLLVGQRSFRETVLNAVSARGHLIYCELPEGKFFVDPADRVVGTNLVWKGSWQHGELTRAVDILRQAGRFRPGLAFIDAGANVGVHTVYALNGGAFGRAISFEPEPANRRLLGLNVAANGLGDRVSIVDKALGNVTGRATLHLHPRNKGAHSVVRRPSYDGTDSLDVPIVRLDEELGPVVSAADIGLVWIDVEGFEPEVVEGLGSYLGQVPLVIEYAPSRYSADRRRAFDRLLAEHYRNLCLIGTSDATAGPLDGLAALDGIVDILVF